MKMLKICRESLVFPLKMIFKATLNYGVFPDDLMKDNIVTAHKKDLIAMPINHRPISLLSIFAKIFEKIIFTSMFEYFIENELFTFQTFQVYQSGFLPGNSCTSQLLTITHEIQIRLLKVHQ